MCQLNENAGYIDLNEDVRLQALHSKQMDEWLE